MDPLLLLLSSLILLHGGLLIVGLTHLHQAQKNLPAIFAAGLLISMMVLAMMFGRWDILLLSFVVYRAWIMLESLLLQGKITSSALALAPINLISISGALVAYFSGIWMIFGFTYLFHWTMTLIMGRRLFARFSS